MQLDGDIGAAEQWTPADNEACKCDVYVSSLSL